MATSFYGPLVGKIIGETPIVPQHKSPFIFRRWSPKEVAISIQQPRRTGKADGNFGQFLDEGLAQVVQDENSLLLAAFVEHRRGKTDNGLERALDLIVLHVEVEGRHED